MRRITIALKINGVKYKVLSIAFSSVDASFFVYDHFKDESSPRNVFPMTHLLKVRGEVHNAPGTPVLAENGGQMKISFHPTRVYLKSRGEADEQKHYWDEASPQPFNRSGYRLHLIYSPPPKEFLPKLTREARNGERFMEFQWSSEKRPEISLYEFDPGFGSEPKCETLPPSGACVIIPADDFHSALGIHLKETQGENPTVWRPLTGVFARVLKKRPLTGKDLGQIIDYNGLNYDISSIPETDIITNFQIIEDPVGERRLLVEHKQS